MGFREYTPVKGPQDIWTKLNLPNEDAKLREQVANGFPIPIFYNIVSLTGLTQANVREAAGLPSTTFLRRKKAGRFTMRESDRLYSMIEVFSRTTHLFDGDCKAAAEWMTKEISGLGNRRPIDMLDTHINTAAVLDLVTRLEYGVYS